MTRNCERVDVLATVPFLGRSGLFPGEVAWGYLQRGEDVRPRPGHPVRLVVHDVEAPANLELPRLGGQLLGGSSDTQLISLRGIEATPDQVRRRLAMADLIELHVHGLLDPRVSDAPSLVLSPNEQGQALLSARDIEQVQLARGPGVFLGACDGAQGANYWSYAHSLPMAFMRAGAQFVIASPAPVEDAGAAPFFEGVWKRLQRGTALSVALRDERQSPRWRAADGDWAQHVVAFY